MRTNRIESKRGAVQLAALLLFAAACSGNEPTAPGNGNPPPGPTPVAVVVVAPEVISLQLHETRQISATPQSADRIPLTDRAVTWTTSDSSVAFVTPHGTVLAQKVGTVTLTATSEGKQGHARVEVSAPPPPPAVASVRVTPGEVTLSEDPATWVLSARTLDEEGRELTGRDVAWSSSDTTVLKVYDGQLVVRGTGTAFVTAVSEGKQGRAKVTVPEWQKTRALQGAAGQPLPALIGTSTYVDDEGIARTVRRVVTEGAIRFSVLGDRYEQRLTVRTYQDGVWVGTERFSDRGTYTYNWLDGTFAFTSTRLADHRFTGAPTHDGGIAVTQWIGEEDAPTTFVFGKM